MSNESQGDLDTGGNANNAAPPKTVPFVKRLRKIKFWQWSLICASGLLLLLSGSFAGLTCAWNVEIERHVDELRAEIRDVHDRRYPDAAEMKNGWQALLRLRDVTDAIEKATYDGVSDRSYVEFTPDEKIKRIETSGLLIYGSGYT